MKYSTATLLTLLASSLVSAAPVAIETVYTTRTTTYYHTVIYEGNGQISALDAETSAAPVPTETETESLPTTAAAPSTTEAAAATTPAVSTQAPTETPSTVSLAPPSQVANLAAAASESTSVSSAPATTDTPAPSAPATTDTPATTAPASPVSTDTPAPASTETPTPASSEPATPASSSAVPSGTGDEHFGQGTYYDPGMGACGGESTASDKIVAISQKVFNQYNVDNNPNKNSLCGKQIRATYQGKSTVVTVVDSCPGCAENDLDLSPSAFSDIADQALGRINLEWTWVN